jgi:hypothetical protein
VLDVALVDGVVVEEAEDGCLNVNRVPVLSKDGGVDGVTFPCRINEIGDGALTTFDDNDDGDDDDDD